MRYALSFAALAALVAASDVHDLTKETFPTFIQENDLVLAEFYAPWCGHCKALAPEYEEAATTLKDKDISLAKVDCTENQELCQEYGVEGYPTLKVFRGSDNISPYTGARKAPAIVSYMTKQALPAVSQLLDKAAYEDFKAADKVVLIGYFAADDKTSNTTFTEVADTLRDSFMFGATSDAALATAAGVKQPSVVLYKTFDEGKAIFDAKFSADAIADFAKVASTPLIGEVGPETYATYMAASLPLAYIFSESPEERTKIAADLKDVAKKHKGVLNFATIDATAFGQHAQNLNLEVGSWPAFAIQDVVKNLKYPYAKQGSIKDLSAKKIGAFVDDFVAGKVEASIKSEPIPEKQDGPVTVVVAKNYKDIVLDDSKDVLLEFYAPWCGHCKTLAPKYDELAALYKGHADKVVIAKVDATANDVPDEIQGFPTIKLFKAGEKDTPIDYAGARTVEDLANFIRDNGSNKIDVMADDDAKAAVDTEGMPSQAPAATKVASSVAKGASGAASSAASGASDAASSAAKGASSGAKGASSAASDAASSAASGASDAASSASSVASDASGAASSAASGVSGSASSAASKVASKAAEGVAGKIAGAMKQAGAVVVDAITEDEAIDDHDEL